jgi:hypothetical protein
LIGGFGQGANASRTKGDSMCDGTFAELPEGTVEALLKLSVCILFGIGDIFNYLLNDNSTSGLAGKGIQAAYGGR